jgi:hypothetical protein
MAMGGSWSGLHPIDKETEDRVEAQTGVEPLVVAGGKYRLASVMAFYRTPVGSSLEASHTTTSEWVATGGQGLACEYWLKRPEWLGRDCIVVDREDGIQAIGRFFQTVEMVDDPRLSACGGYRVAICRGLLQEASIR